MYDLTWCYYSSGSKMDALAAVINFVDPDNSRSELVKSSRRMGLGTGQMAIYVQYALCPILSTDFHLGHTKIPL